MKRILSIFALTAMFSMGAFAQNDILDDYSKLTPTQKAAIVTEIAKSVTANEAKEVEATKAKTPVPDQVDKWVNVGTNVGKGLAGAAKETNIAVNEFARTPVGILTTCLIMWHFMGGALVHIFGGLILFTVGFWTIRGYSARSRKRTESILKDGTKLVEIEALTTDMKVVVGVGYLVIIILTLATVFSF